MTISQDVTTVAVTKATHARLAGLKGYGDSFEHVIVKLLDQKEDDKK